MSKKVQQLAEVIALQERTIGKLQRVIDCKKSAGKRGSDKKNNRYVPSSFTKKLDFNPIPTNTLNRKERSHPSVSQNQISQISTEYAQELNTLREKLEEIKFIRQDVRNREDNVNLDLKRELLEKDKQIADLQIQLQKERHERQQTQAELNKQKSTWQQMYQELQTELDLLKRELKHFSSPQSKIGSRILHFQGHL
ncbi:hypothetical protein pb186bvf_017607 [Paramecium bursaria]